jgi:hypothetical protein
MEGCHILLGQGLYALRSFHGSILWLGRIPNTKLRSGNGFPPAEKQNLRGGAKNEKFKFLPG